MNGASKILTVSYGTFSCTLEGFDDPFNTMKSIAEYFRDLAADDRYFGAEPPTPDPVMLHKIAEREIQRRVEAKIQENGVILRADDRPDDRAMPRVTMPAAPAPAPAPLATPLLATPHLSSVAEAGPAVESAAARLSRLRAAQSPVPAPAATVIIAPVSPLGDISSRFADIEAYAEDQDAYSAPAAVAVLAEPEPVAPADVVATVAAIVEPNPAPVADETAVIDQIDLANQTDLANQIDLTNQTDLADMVHADPLPATEITPASAENAQPDTTTEAILASLRDAVAPELAPATEPATDPAPVETHDVLAALRETLAGMTAQDDQLAADIALATDMASEVASDVLPTADDLPEDAYDDVGLLPQSDDHIALSDLMKLDGMADAEPAPTEMLDDASQLQAPLIDDAAYLDTDSDQPAIDSTAAQSVIVAQKADRARARVIKIRRLDKKPIKDATLTPEAEADLQNTLAALSAEIAPLGATEPETGLDAELAPQIAGAADAETAPADMMAVDVSVEALLDAELAVPATQTDVAVANLAQTDTSPEARIGAADDAAVDRLLAQTNTQFDVPEVKRRRSAIAHLKAAVLATVADRRINPNAAAKGTEVKMDPYRKDLDQAVRPAAPAERPAPLVLVSAQRIDTKRDLVADAGRPVPQIVPSVPAPAPSPGPTAVQPVRPRRVTSGGAVHAVSTISVDEDEVAPQSHDNIFADGQKPSFSDFAEQLGAESTSELIEAAGVYCTLVLERPSFTRPLLFQQLATMDKMGDLNPEEGLIGFGRLLRNGRIQKSARGQFALSTTSPLLTEAKRIAG